MSSVKFRGRLGLQQRVLPAYRVPFFDLLAQSCQGGLSLFAGLSRPDEGITSADLLRLPYCVPAKNRHFFRGVLYVCYQQGMIHWLERTNPQALIVEANPRYLATPAAVRWMKARRRPAIGWGLGAPPLSGPLAGFRQRRRIQFLSQFEALIAYSRRGAEEYAASGFPRDRIFVATNAVAPRPTFRAPRSTAYERPTILFVGRLQARKRVDVLLRACAEMPEPKPRLVIVGDGPARENLQRLAREVYPQAEFVGARQGDELRPYFMEADLFVLPGTGGLAVQQAMSYGLPVIVAKGDGTQDDLVRPQNGWQVAPEDFEALLSALREALADVRRLRAMGAESYRIVAEEVNIEKMVEVFVEALNSLTP